MNEQKSEQQIKYYDAALPHINPKDGVWCPCAFRYTGNAQPRVDYTHFMINPFSGSEALCDSVHNGECVSLDAESVNCPRCLPLMSEPIAVESERQRVATEQRAEQEWRRSDPGAARLYDALRRRRQ
jgi:hypothetical protein